jgi:HNH endonuclease
MGSLFLNSLSDDQRRELVRRLHQTQGGKCFICERPISLELHADALDIDHVEPLKIGGKDDPSNFALTHATCNRSKQASDLRVARVLARFAAIRDEAGKENRSPNLGDVLKRYRGAAYELPIKRNGASLSFSYPDLARNDIDQVPVYRSDGWQA